MNECLNNEPNYITYYNSIQMCLPLGLGYEITPTDELLSFLEAIKGVDLSKYMVRKETRGIPVMCKGCSKRACCKSYHFFRQ